MTSNKIRLTAPKRAVLLALADRHSAECEAGWVAAVDGAANTIRSLIDADLIEFEAGEMRMTEAGWAAIDHTATLNAILGEDAPPADPDALTTDQLAMLRELAELSVHSASSYVRLPGAEHAAVRDSVITSLIDGGLVAVAEHGYALTLRGWEVDNLAVIRDRKRPPTPAEARAAFDELSGTDRAAMETLSDPLSARGTLLEQRVGHGVVVPRQNGKSTAPANPMTVEGGFSEITSTTYADGMTVVDESHSHATPLVTLNPVMIVPPPVVRAAEMIADTIASREGRCRCCGARAVVVDGVVSRHSRRGRGGRRVVCSGTARQPSGATRLRLS